MKELIVVAVGGNSLIRDQAHIDAESQYENCKETCSHITALLKAGYRVVISHGNGPQVGFLLRCSELASAEVPRSPLGVCVANTQGSIGYMFQRAEPRYHSGGGLAAQRECRNSTHNSNGEYPSP